MNANQIINMVIRQVVNRVIRTGVNKGMNVVGDKMSRNKPASQTPPQDQGQP